MWGKESVSDPFRYHQWAYQIHLDKSGWITVYERRQAKGDPEDVEKIFAEHKPIALGIKHIIDSLTPEVLQLVRNIEDGGYIDINAAIDVMVAIRIGEQSSPRITMRNVLMNRDLAVAVLMDLSESINETMQDLDKTILQLTRQASTF